MDNNTNETPNQQRPLRIIEAGRNRNLLSFEDIWTYRSLLSSLVERNVKVRYKNTALGVLWMALQPALQMAIYTIIFGLWAKLPSNGVPYAVFVTVGLVHIFFINGVISSSTNTVRSNQAVSKKIYFPKIILPVVVLISALVDYSVYLILLTVVMIFHGVVPSANIVYLPVVFVSLMITLLGLSVWFTALGARFVDTKMIVPALSMLVVYLSPVIYPISIIPERFLTIYGLINPFAGHITALKWTIIGVEPFYPWMFAYSSLLGVVLCISGLVFFARTERSFNDYL